MLCDTSYIDYYWFENYMCMIIGTYLSSFNIKEHKFRTFSFILFNEETPIYIYRNDTKILVEEIILYDKVILHDSTKYSASLLSGVIPILLDKNNIPIESDEAFGHKSPYNGGSLKLNWNLNWNNKLMLFILIMLIIIIVVIVVIVIIKRNKKEEYDLNCNK